MPLQCIDRGRMEGPAWKTLRCLSPFSLLMPLCCTVPVCV